MFPDDRDGARLLNSPAVGEVLRAAVTDAGGAMQAWEMEHVDHQPGRLTTATYRVEVAWGWGNAAEVLGVTVRVGGPTRAEREGARIYRDELGNEVMVWIYPADPALPGLARVAYAEGVADLVNAHGLWVPRGGVLAARRPVVGPHDIRLSVVGYRPRQRAVLRADIRADGEDRRYYLKVQTPEETAHTVECHRLLRGAGVPAPEVMVSTPDSVTVLEGLAGKPLTQAIFQDPVPGHAEEMIALLDAFPPAVAGLPRRTPWTESVHYYVGVIVRAMPELEARLAWVADQVTQGLAGLPPGDEATHGDFHEGQVHVRDGHVVGILDIDGIGPGRRADDLGCMVAHLSTIQRMNADQAARLQALLEAWIPVFDQRVDPTELRLRAAGVAISLATGPYRSQEERWREETVAILESAEALVRQVG